MPAAREAGQRTLVALQVTTGSTLGAISLETCGLLIDHGWLRILGAGGCSRMPDGLTAWNGTGSGGVIDPARDGFVIVAHDAIGGFYALNGGAFDGPQGNVFYFTPDSLQWEDRGIGYTEFVRWALLGDVAGYYENVRWRGWEKEVEPLANDRGLAIFPFLWSKESRPLAKARRTRVPMRELWSLHISMARRLR